MTDIQMMHVRIASLEAQLSESKARESKLVELVKDLRDALVDLNDEAGDCFRVEEDQLDSGEIVRWLELSCETQQKVKKALVDTKAVAEAE